MAREFEDKGYSPNSELVEILDMIKCRKDAVLREAIKEWVIDNKIEPKFQIGDTTIVKRGVKRLVGEITGIHKDTAEYLVCIPSEGMTKEGAFRAIVKYENAQLSHNWNKGDRALNILHIYSQQQWHDEAYIAGDRESLQLLADAINKALSSGTGECQACVNDGEGFDVYVVRIDHQQTLDKLAVPYTKDVAEEKDSAAIWPWNL